VDKGYSEQGVVAIAFHPGGVVGTKIADQAPEWLRKNFKDTRKSFFVHMECQAIQ
jgi:hypothetical protein